MKEITKKARVFNIERFATEDGKGIRTLVFLKGCDLRCKWCANPESQSFKKQIIFHSNLCNDCGKCMDSCKVNAIDYKEGYGYITNTDLCSGCGECVENCYNNARSFAGTDYTVDELIVELLKDKKYYEMSGGGVTFSGGEPLFYSKFIKECALKLKEENITTLIETCGYIANENIKYVADEIDYIFYDIKHMNSIKHKELTGQDNKLILSNLEWLSKNFKGELSIRYPYIPNCNNDKEAIDQFIDYISNLDNIYEIVFLPYHRLGLPKYLGLGRDYEMDDMKSLKKSEIKYLVEKYKSYNLNIKIQ